MTSADQLTSAIEASTDSTQVVNTTLKTSERVLARVTDGIYRQPGSALRELVANAYDADASQVIVLTDAPRFAQITVEDDGAGMSPATLAHLLQNIGGSAKRRSEGAALGVTAPDDRMRSPNGRRLVGRIGIGLFSVSQLTQSFQITTKVKSDHYRTVATVVLKQYGEAAGPGTEDDGDYEAGRVKIWREPALDVDSHGTSIVLDQIRPQTRRTLQSDSIWQAVEGAEAEDGDGQRPPRFHIGRVVGGRDSDELRTGGQATDSVPWGLTDSPKTAFRKLVDAVWRAVEDGGGNPKLDTLFDFYLQMVWQLSLSVPLPYVGGHPFAIPFGDAAHTYEVMPDRRVSPRPVALDDGATLAAECALGDAEATDGGPFTVLVDELALSRPLLFEGLPTTGHALKRPILFVGKCREAFEGVPVTLTGGPLAFEAYLLWNPKIAPTEHQGSLLRIHGASGTLFDPTFMRYQVSEQTRKQQITCEIFVNEGLEGAMNIDRESFNFAHPHVVFLTQWLHNALRKLATTQKSLAAEVRHKSRDARAAQHETRLDAIAKGSWVAATGDEDVVPPLVTFSTADGSPPRSVGQARADAEATNRDYVVLDAGRVFRDTTKENKAARQLAERQLATIASVLAAYGLADLLPEAEFEDLLAALREVLRTDAT